MPRNRAYANDDQLVAPHNRWARWLHAARIAQLLFVAAFLTMAIGTMYYFNRLVDLEQNVNTAAAQIDRELQRRVDLIRNLLPAVFEYAALERQVFTEVAKVRAQLAAMAKGSTAALPKGISAGALTTEALSTQALSGDVPLASADPVGSILRRLVAVVEQYPDMKSSVPFKLLMEKTVEIEDRLAVERQNYNDTVNIYTTETASFPGRVFAQVFGFESHELFAADTGADRSPAVGWPMAER